MDHSEYSSESEIIFDRFHWFNLLIKYMEHFHPDYLFKITDDQYRIQFLKNKIISAHQFASTNIKTLPLDVIQELACEQLFNGLEFSLYYFLDDYGQTFYPEFYQYMDNKLCWEQHLINTCIQIRSLIHEDAFFVEEVIKLPLGNFFN